MAAVTKRYVITEYRIDATKARAALDQIRVSATQSAKSLAQIEKASKSSAASLGGLSSGFSRAAMAIKSFVAYMAVQKLQGFVDSTIDMNTRLLAVTGSTAAANAKFEDLLAIGNRLGVGVDVLANSFAKLKVSLPEQDAADVTKAIELIGTVTATTGATVQQTNAVFLQLSQALSSGALQGDEFRSVYENAPVLLRAWQDAIGKSSANLRDLSKNAELTTESFFKNLDAIRANVVEMTKMEKPPLTIGRALAVLANNLRAVLKDFEQATGLINKTASALAWLAENLDTAALAVGAFAAAWMLMNISATGSALGILTKTVATLSLAVQGLGAAFVSLGAAFAIGGAAAKVLVGVLSAVTFVGFYEAGKYIRSAVAPLGDLREELEKVEVVRDRLSSEGFRDALSGLSIADDADYESLKRVRDEVQATADVIQAEYVRGLEELDKWYNQLPGRQETLKNGLTELTREWGNAGAAAYDISRAIEEYEKRTQAAGKATDDFRATLRDLNFDLAKAKSEYDALVSGGLQEYERIQRQNADTNARLQLVGQMTKSGITDPGQIQAGLDALDTARAYEEKTRALIESTRAAEKASASNDKLSKSEQGLASYGERAAEILNLTGKTKQRFLDLLPAIDEVSKRYGIQRELLIALIKQESSFNQGARSKAGAFGVSQLMPDTAKDLGRQLGYSMSEMTKEAQKNLEAGALYLRQQLAKTGGDVERALRAYNAGPGKIDQSYKFKETNNYVATIIPDAQRLTMALGDVNAQYETMEELQRRIAENRMQGIIDTVAQYRDLVVSLETPLETLKRKQAEINELKAQFEAAGGTFEPEAYYKAMGAAAQEAIGSVQGLIDTYMPAEAITRMLAQAELGLAAAIHAKNITADQAIEILARYKEELVAAANDLYTTRNAAQDLKSSLYGGFESAIVEGKKLRDVLKGILEDIARIILKATLGNAISMGVNALFKIPTAAAGASMYSTMPQGLYTSPTLFPMREPGLHAFASGVGLLGEAGPEYIMPAVRMPNGDMGVQAQAAPVQVTVNNNVRGADVNVRETPQGLTLDVVERHVAAAFAAGGNPIARAAEGAYPNLRRGRL